MVMVIGETWALGDDSPLAAAMLPGVLEKVAPRPVVVPPYADDLAARYRSGASARACAAAFGVSYGQAHRILRVMGVEMRPPGGSRRPGAPS